MKLIRWVKARKSELIYCTINAALLVVFTFTWINHSYILTDDEEGLIKYTTLTKNIVYEKMLGQEKNPPKKEDFLFVNLSWEKQLIDVKDKNGKVIGKRAITDRKRVAKFFEYLNEDPKHKFIILDVWFKDSSDYTSDSLLQAQFSKTKNFLIPYHKSDSNDKVKDMPIFNAPTALSDYEKDDFDNNFVKFRLVQGDHFKTTPLVMYESLHGKKFSDEGFWNYLGNKLSLNSFILRLRIWNHSFEERVNKDGIAETEHTKIQLSELLDTKPEGLDSLPEVVRAELINNLRSGIIHEVTKDKIIVIGDFEDSDVHETIYGPTAGPLILLNVYLALANGDNIINWRFVLFLFAGYFLISYKCFANIDLLDRYIIGKIIPATNIRSVVAGFIDYLIYFVLLSVISYFLFNVHLTILLLAIYMELLQRSIRVVKRRIRKRNLVTGSPSIVS